MRIRSLAVLIVMAPALLAACSPSYEERMLVHPEVGPSPVVLEWHRPMVRFNTQVVWPSSPRRPATATVVASESPALPEGSVVELGWWPAPGPGDARFSFCASRIVRPDGTDLFGGTGTVACLATLAGPDGMDGIVAAPVAGRPGAFAIPAGLTATLIPRFELAPAPSMSPRVTVYPKSRYYHEDSWYEFR